MSKKTDHSSDYGNITRQSTVHFTCVQKGAAIRGAARRSELEHGRHTSFKTLVLIFLCTSSIFSASSCGCGAGHKTGQSVTTDSETVIATLRGPSTIAMLQVVDSLSAMTSAAVEGNSPYPLWKIEIFDEPMQVRKKMLQGEVDFAVLPSTMAALLHNKGVDYTVAAVPLWGTLFLCGDRNRVSSIKDLKGKHIYTMAKGMTPDILLRHILKRNGIDPEVDVTLDYRFPTHIDLANATASGRADLSVLSEPYLSLVLEKNPSMHRLIDLSREWESLEGIPLAETALVVKREFASGHPDRVKAFVDAYRKSGEWVNGHIEEAARLAVKYGIVPDTSAAAGSIPHSHINVVASDEARTALKSCLEVFFNADSRITGGEVSDDFFFINPMH